MEAIHELTAGYALDALDPEEREAYERHLADCEACQEELASFWEVTGALAAAANGPAPSPALRTRILDAVRAEQQTVVPFERRRNVLPPLAVVTAIAAAVAIGLGIYSISLNNQLDDSKAALDDANTALNTQKTAAAVLADPNATTIPMQAGSGRLVVASDGSAVLVLDKLAAAPSGKTYQAWVVKGESGSSAGTFAASNGFAVVPIPGKVPDGAVVAVTVEDAPGATSPTLPPVAASHPV